LRVGIDEDSGTVARHFGGNAEIGGEGRLADAAFLACENNDLQALVHGIPSEKARQGEREGSARRRFRRQAIGIEGDGEVM
jgi:hypothetical protein